MNARWWSAFVLLDDVLVCLPASLLRGMMALAVCLPPAVLLPLALLPPVRYRESWRITGTISLPWVSYATFIFWRLLLCRVMARRISSPVTTVLFFPLVPFCPWPLFPPPRYFVVAPWSTFGKDTFPRFVHCQPPLVFVVPVWISGILLASLIM